MEPSTNTQSGTHRLRASRACKACHERRVKCDAFEHGIPCSRCKNMSLSGCAFIKSKRGTYTRQHKKSDQMNSGQRRTVRVSSPGQNRRAESNIMSSEPVEAINIRENSVAVGEQERTSVTEPHSGRVGSSQQIQNEDTNQVTESDSSADHNQVLLGLDLTTPNSQISDTSRTSYREATWTSMFEHVLSARRDQDPSRAIDKCSITYLGETFPLAMVLEDLKQGGRIRLHHAGPPIPDDSVGPMDNQQHPNHLQPEEAEFLKAKGAFDYPHEEILTAFATTFLDRVYPCYPIVNRREFMGQLEQKKLPWLLLQSFCFICSTFCPLAVLHRAKFQSRKQARTHYYNRAKALFDTGYEIDKIVILQSVILLAFWAGGPNDYWNFYSWNSTGITVAEAMGIHRSMNQANMRKEDVSLLRRLWWILAIRDASCGALIGRPFRINMYYCDTEMLTVENFDDDREDPAFALHPLHDTIGLYQIHMAKLSLILRQIVKEKYDVKNGRFESSNLNESLTQWRKELPERLQLSSNPENVFAQCLAMVYDHHLILANLDKAIFSLPTPHEGGTTSATSITLVNQAAQRILNHACAIVRKSIQASMPHECFPALFLAEVVFYAQMRSPQSHRAALGQSAVNTCQMVWHSVLDTWDSAPWVMKMFDTLIKNAQDEATTVEEANVILPPPSAHPLPSFDVSDMDFGEVTELWQSHPMLSSMFDISLDQGHFSINGISGVPFMFDPTDDTHESMQDQDQDQNE